MGVVMINMLGSFFPSHRSFRRNPCPQPEGADAVMQSGLDSETWEHRTPSPIRTTFHGLGVAQSAMYDFSRLSRFRPGQQTSLRLV